MKCPSCGYKHNEMNDDWELEYKDTKPFKNIKGHFTMEYEDGYNEREVYLVACPECNVVILKD